ncbi:S1 RNA binding domain-containing protein [Cryptosporidium andersoni]|uniref:S1 RNA binding domain-containing protein n=1 Tax=Cryptosporidium andersoni TaxID=117008 RepID=A0A1J4MRR5_9CRYT|nr:S1 RNA binding domain-containing protein [Cryptosporidium andersoni]
MGKREVEEDLSLNDNESVILDLDTMENLDSDFIGLSLTNKTSKIPNIRNIHRDELVTGTLLFCVIDGVYDKELKLSLPGGHFGLATINNTLEDEASNEKLRNLSLDERFKAGDIVIAAIIYSSKGRVEVTIRPSIVNAGLTSSSKALGLKGYVISATIISIEDYGYTLNVSIPGIRMAFIKCETGDLNARSMSLGHVLPVYIDEYMADQQILLCQPLQSTCNENSSNIAILGNEILESKEIRPGMKVECRIQSIIGQNGEILPSRSRDKDRNTKITPKSNDLSDYIKTLGPDGNEIGQISQNEEVNVALLVTFSMGAFIGIIPAEHNYHPLQNIMKKNELNDSNNDKRKRRKLDSQKVVRGSFITARVIAIISGKKKRIVLSLLPHINSNLCFFYKKPIISTGSRIVSYKNIDSYSENLKKKNSVICMRNVVWDNNKKDSSIKLLLYVHDYKNEEVLEKKENDIELCDRWLLVHTKTTNIKGNIRIGSEIQSDCRFLIFSRIEHIGFVTFDSKLVNEPYLCSRDVTPGDIVYAQVVNIKPWGLSVKLSDFITGRVYREHLLNTRISKKQKNNEIDYIKKHYQVGRSYKFRILRFEQNNISWNPMLLLTAKNRLINDELPAIIDPEKDLSIGKVAVGYISRVSRPNEDPNDKSGFIIVRFFGQVFGSLSYNEYIDKRRKEGINSNLLEPNVGDILTVRIVHVDPITKLIKLEIADSIIDSSTNILPIFKVIFSDMNYFDQSKIYQLLGTNNYISYPNTDQLSSVALKLSNFICPTKQGLLFLIPCSVDETTKYILCLVPRNHISDDVNYSSVIHDLLMERYKQSKSLDDIQGILNESEIYFTYLSNPVHHNLEIYCRISKQYKDISLNLPICSLKQSLLRSKVFIKHESDLNNITIDDIYLGYIRHIDNYGLLVSLGRWNMTGIVPKHLIGRITYFDGVSMLKDRFTLDQTVSVKVLKNELIPTRSLILSIKDGNFKVANNDIEGSFVNIIRNNILYEKIISNLCMYHDSYLMRGSVISFEIDSVETSNKNTALILTKDNLKFNAMILDDTKINENEIISGIVFNIYFKENRIVNSLLISTNIINSFNLGVKLIDEQTRKLIKNIGLQDTNWFELLLDRIIPKLIDNQEYVEVDNTHLLIDNGVFCLQCVKLQLNKIKEYKHIDTKISLPILLYGNKISNSDSKSYKCLIKYSIPTNTLDKNKKQIPIMVGIIKEIMKESSIRKFEGNNVLCKVVGVLQGYEGLIVKFDEKNYGRIHCTELDDIWINDPISEDRFKVGEKLTVKVLGKLSKNKRVLISHTGSKKYVQLIWDASNRSSIIKNIETSSTSRPKSISDIKLGSLINGYIKYSGKQGVFVHIGRDLIGRIKLRELSNKTTTEEEARELFPIGKLLNPILVIGGLEENKIDLSLFRLQSDNIILKISQQKDYSELDDLNSHGNGEEQLSNYEINLLGKLRFEDLYIGRILAGKIKHVSTKFGIFVTLKDTIDGLNALCPLNESMNDYSNKITQFLPSIYKVGDDVLCKIIKIDSNSNRIWVSLKEKNFEELLDEDSESKSTDNEDNQLMCTNDTTQNLSNSEIISEEYLADNELLHEHIVIQNDIQNNMQDSIECNVHEYSEDEILRENELQEKPRNRQQKLAKQLAAEHEIRSEELKLIESSVNPQSINDFERLLISHKDVSSLWIKYMSYFLELDELEKARIVAERALRNVSYSEDMERWNIWIAYLNMEIAFGKFNINNSSEKELPKNFELLFERAYRNVGNPKKLYIQCSQSLSKFNYNVWSLLILEKALKKFSKSRKVWLEYIKCLFKNNKVQQARDEVIPKALQSIGRIKLIRLITDIARVELEYGNFNRARTIFENLISENPKRIDLWSQYFDALIKYFNSSNSEVDINIIRSIFKSAIRNDLKPRKMKFLFSRWLAFEKEYGSLEDQKIVQKYAAEYVQKIESNI